MCDVGPCYDGNRLYIWATEKRSLFIHVMRNNRTIKFSITVCYNVLLSECTQIRTISISNDYYSIDLVLTLKYSKQSWVCKYNYMPLPLGAKSISVFFLYFVDKRFDIYSLKIVAEKVVSVGCFIKIKFRWNWNGVSSFLHQYVFQAMRDMNVLLYPPAAKCLTTL